MLLWLAQNFRRISLSARVQLHHLRAVLATLTALLIGLIAGPAVIRMLTA
jgi:phospho-N-acetylmuramoyl-pentapeptide-transferase